LHFVTLLRITPILALKYLHTKNGYGKLQLVSYNIIAGCVKGYALDEFQSMGRRD